MSLPFPRVSGPKICTVGGLWAPKRALPAGTPPSRAERSSANFAITNRGRENGPFTIGQPEYLNRGRPLQLLGAKRAGESEGAAQPPQLYLSTTG